MDDAATDDGIQRGEGGAGGWGRGNPWKKFALTEKGRGVCERLLNSGEETRRKIDEMREKMLNDYGGKSK